MSGPGSLVDIHNHLVPGVDDGARDLDAVLESVERMTGAGIRRIVTTPHIQASLTVDPPALKARLDEVSGAFETAAAAVAERFPEVDFRRGHEIMVDVPEPDLSDPRLRMAETRFVLIEWPRLRVPPGTTRVLEWLCDQGFRPVIAHPERYAGVTGNLEILRRWKGAGACLQLNYGSVVGRYGAEPCDTARRILEAGLADYLASDFHGRPALKIYAREACAALSEHDPGGVLETLGQTNPARLMDGLDPLPVDALRAPRRLFELMRRFARRARRELRA